MRVAMAAGTGKTFTPPVNQVYRLMKSGVARRIVFVARPCLALPSGFALR
jgi:type I site-specific restriction endonuclease